MNDENGRPSQRKTDESARRVLERIGARVRAGRARRGMTRRMLAGDSGVSERYIAQLEAGTGNPSVAVLLEIARAMTLDIADLVIEDATLVRLIGRLDDDARDEARALLTERFGEPATIDRRRRVALVGLRGAGKSTLGKRLADASSVPFVELARHIEQASGTGIGDLLALSGQAAFRRWERRCLEAVVDGHDAVVIATGGGIVANPETYEFLLARTHTVWLQASPDEHMSRVVAQGDLRPMARNPEAMSDLRAILSAREPDYARAAAVLDTSGRTADESAAMLIETVNRLL